MGEKGDAPTLESRTLADSRPEFARLREYIGKAIAVGKIDADPDMPHLGYLCDLKKRGDKVEYLIMSTRPYGAPITLVPYDSSMTILSMPHFRHALAYSPRDMFYSPLPRHEPSRGLEPDSREKDPATLGADRPD